MANTKAFKIKNGLDLGAYSKAISDTAVDIFVYDTRKDSDGGAWRKRTQHTSWYNETLNTSTRGSRREFPAVAVIVAESNTVTIYDGDDPDLPMWFVYDNISKMAAGSSSTGITAFNGSIVISRRNPTLEYRGGIIEMSFAADFIRWLRGSAISSWQVSPSLVDRMDNFASDGSGITLVDGRVNDVAMTVLPNAPIDAATGLPVPTIAVATEGGLSVIKDDGTIVDITGATGYTKSKDVSFTDENRIAYTLDDGNSTFGYRIDDIPSSDFSATNTVYQKQNSLVFSYMENGVGSQNDFHVIKTTSENSRVFVGDKAIGMNVGLTIPDVNYEAAGNSQMAFVTSSYNSGWQSRFTKLATLSDTDDTNVTGSELLNQDGTEWSLPSGFTMSSGTLAYDGTNTQYNKATDRLSGLTVGQTYTVSFNVTAISGSSVWVVAHDQGAVTGHHGGVNFTSTGRKTFTFKAETAQDYIVVQNNSALQTFTITDFSVRISEADRSVNGNGLQVFSTVNKSAVATGSDLVGYSNFTNSTSYLQQPHLASNEIGSGNACSMIWFKTSASGVSEMLISFEGEAYDTAFNIRKETGNHITGWATSDGFSTNLAVNSNTVLNDNTWHHAAWVKQGTTYSLYVDGRLNDTGTYANALDYDSNDEKITIGRRTRLQGDPFYGQLALARFSLTAPSAEQIKYIYESEKVLFQDNAQATLYGSSDAVTALAYDDSTELLHVGTSAGRSVFQGLRRVDNTTTAVGAAISASNGLVADE